jgi:hypothetical protein
MIIQRVRYCGLTIPLRREDFVPLRSVIVWVQLLTLIFYCTCGRARRSYSSDQPVSTKTWVH